MYEDNDRAEKIVKSQRLLGGCCVINYIIDLVQLIIKLRQINITPTDFSGFLYNAYKLLLVKRDSYHHY
jgi:hypothetical protein